MRRAKSNGRSMEAEVRDILSDSVRKEAAPKRGLGRRLGAVHGRGIYLDKPIEEIRGLRMEIPDFDK